MSAVHAFVERLQAQPRCPGVFNPWSQHDPENDLCTACPDWRAEHLAAYLSERAGRARWLLVAEAPGYQGAKRSGIAMTSERMLLGGLVEKGIEPKDILCSPPRRTSRPEVHPSGVNEPTATIVWSQLKTLGLDTREIVLWNAFAFHPHRAGEPLSNRAPTRGEVASGRALLEQFRDVFADAEVVAVGKVAQGLLTELSIEARSVRHPSMGGAAQFREQFAVIARERC